MNFELNIFRRVNKNGFFHLLTANLFIQVVLFASQLFVAGILAPDDIGRIKIIQTYLSFFSIIAGLGFNSSTLKLCSENRSKKELADLFQSALFFTIFSTFSIYTVILVLNLFKIFSPDKLVQWLIPLGLFPIISNSLFMVFISYFQSIKEIKTLSNLTVLNKILSIVGIVIFTYFMGIKGYYLAYNLSFILMIFVCYRTLNPISHEKFFSKKQLSYLPIHWHYAKSSMLANLLAEMSAFIDMILISFFVKEMHQIGYYSFALTITVILRLFPSTVQQITTPYFSSLAHQKNEFMILFKRYNRVLYGVVLLTLIGALLIIPVIIHWIFVGKYDPFMQYFPFLAIGWSFRMLAQVQSGAIFGLGKMQYIAYTSLITLLFNILVISILIYFFGLIGAAYASVLGGIVYILCSRYFFRKAKNEMIS